ncbi:MAG: hypothetical protein Q7L55_10135 [Actinomycetota bacterium]|nr:hypothetical protein [Actinomycetota bacterium]
MQTFTQRAKDSLARRTQPIRAQLTRSWIFLGHECLVVIRNGRRSEIGSFVISDAILAQITQAYELSTVIEAEPATAGPSWNSADLTAPVYAKLNAHHVFRDGVELLAQIAHFAEVYDQQIRGIIKSPYRIVNIRAWSTLPDREDFGPTAWHTDGFGLGHMKAMIYLQPLDTEHGGIAILGRDLINGSAGTCVIFDNSSLRHRGLASSTTDRPVIEVTLQRLMKPPASKAPLVGTNNDRHMKRPTYAYKAEVPGMRT